MADDNANTTFGSAVAGIKKLKGVPDYQDWKFQVRNLLENKNLWVAIEPGTTAAGVPKTVDAEKDRVARTTICLLVDPCCFSKVRNARSAKEAWQNLCSAYEDKGWGRRISLQRALWKCKLEDFGTMDEYVSKIMSLAHQLEDIDAKVTDDWLISILLSGLTAEYRPMVMAIDNSGQAITSEQVMTKLTQEANRQLGSESTSSGESALFAKGKKPGNHSAKHAGHGSNNKPTEKKKFVFKCFRCHKEGHKSSECPDKKATASGTAMLAGLAVDVRPGK